jgi:hypothetical protein
MVGGNKVVVVAADLTAPYVSTAIHALFMKYFSRGVIRSCYFSIGIHC